jgi:hypothetical protein
MQYIAHLGPHEHATTKRSSDAVDPTPLARLTATLRFPLAGVFRGPVALGRCSSMAPPFGPAGLGPVAVRWGASGGQGLLGGGLLVRLLATGCFRDGSSANGRAVFDAECSGRGRKARTNKDAAAEVQGELPGDAAADRCLNGLGSPRAVEVREAPPAYPPQIAPKRQI